MSTAVREDLFAGFLTNDMPRFELGERRVDEILRINPRHAQALAWKGGAQLYRAVRASESGNQADFAKHLAAANAMFDQAYSLAPKDQAVLAITGGSWAVMAERLPSPDRKEAWRNVESRYGELAAAQAGFFANLPLHHRGEVLAGLAQAAQRMGDTAKAEERLRRIIAELPGSPYASRAQRWLEQPEVAAKSGLTCQTCHEPGRLVHRIAGVE